MFIAMELKGSVPVMSEEDLMKFAQEAVREMDIMVRTNMAESGRPGKWPVLRSGRFKGQPSHLYESGFLYEHIRDNVRQEEGMTIATVGINQAEVPYASIHQHGGVIHHPGSKGPVPIQTPNGVIFRYMKEPRDINIPARPYLVWVDETVQWIRNNIGNAVASILKVHQEPL